MELYLNYWFFFFFIFPIIEWGSHYFLHLTENKIHFIHHDNVTKNRLNKKHDLTMEIWPIFPILFCLYNTFYIGVLFFSKYYVIHTLIHFYPNVLPELSNHHNTHHVYSKYNFCVTNIWPDRLFNTLYIKQKLISL